MEFPSDSKSKEGQNTGHVSLESSRQILEETTIQEQSPFQIENKTSKTGKRRESNIHKDVLLKHFFLASSSFLSKINNLSRTNLLAR